MSRIVANSLLILALAAPLAAQVPATPASAQPPTGQNVPKSQATTHKKHTPAKKVRSAKKANVATQVPTQIEPMAPEQLPALAPQVSYLNGQLTILSQNSTLSDILSSIQKKTGVEIELPPGAGAARVATQIGPAPAREALTTLLQATNLNFIIIGNPDHPEAISKVLLTPREGGAEVATNNRAGRPGGPPPSDYSDPNNVPVSDDDSAEAAPEPTPPPEQEPPQQQAEQAPPFGQPQVGADPNAGQGPGGQMAVQGAQPGVRTPEQMLQELQRLRGQLQDPNAQQAPPQPPPQQ
jgi:hypothetical protein